MMQRDEEKNGKWAQMCDELGLSQEEKEAALAFFSGEAGEEVLQKISYRDLAGANSNAFQMVANEMMRKDKDWLHKLFLFLFAVGETTCNWLLSKIYVNYRQLNGVDPVKVTATYAANIGRSTYRVTAYVMADIMAFATRDLNVMEQAMGYGSLGGNAKIVLSAAYFWLKYQSNGKVRAVKKEDRERMQQYETMLAKALCHFYDNGIGEEKEKELVAGIASGKIPEEFLSCKGKTIGQLFRLVAGMAYYNYPLSKHLEDIVRICMAVSYRETLDSMRVISTDSPLDLNEVGGHYDTFFGIDSADYIEWAREKSYVGILKEQASCNQEAYLVVMEKANILDACLMLSYLEDVEPTLYRKLVEEKRNEYKERVIAKLTEKDIQADGDAARPYLRGESGMKPMFLCFLGNDKRNFYNGGYEYGLLKYFDRNFKDGEFFRRCEVYMVFRRASYFFRSLIDDENVRDNKVDPKRVVKLLQDLDAEGLPLEYQMLAVAATAEGLYSGTEEDFKKGVIEYFSSCLKERKKETVDAFARADVYVRLVGLQLLNKDAEQNKEEILQYVQDGSKAVKEELFKILCARKEWEEEIKGLVGAKKAAEREFAVRVLAAWQKDGADYREFFSQAMEKEKNAKVQELLGNVLGAEGGAAGGVEVLSREDLVKSLHKGGKKRSLLWAYETPFSAVHFAGSTKNGKKADAIVADEEYLQAILLCYVSAKDASASAAGGGGISKNAQFLADALRADEFAVYVNELFDKWLAAGAESKKRWVLYAAAIHGGSGMVTKLEHQIKEWPQEARGAIACEAVKALSLSPLPQALLIVDGIARKFKFKQVRAAANDALVFAAGQLGITREELADRIVPDFGFDENLERCFDYGTRAFLVTMTPALEIEVYEAKQAEDGGFVRGKKLKNIPAPGAKDDAERAKAAYEDFKQLKKQMKVTVASQRARLEMALSTAREWDVPAWKQLFVKNPVMHQFAIGLIWGIYGQGKLLQSFRYMEDGSFNTSEEEEYELPESGKIGLVHPVDLTKEERKAWEQQLEDYEIAQPFEQLKRTVYTVTKEEENEQKLMRFDGKALNDLSLGSKLSGFGWYRGSVQDGGGFDTYFREDVELGLGVELHFSGSYVGGSNEDVTVYDARFYRAGEVKRGSYMYDEADEGKALFMKDIPARYFSEVVWQLTKVTA